MWRALTSIPWMLLTSDSVALVMALVMMLMNMVVMIRPAIIHTKPSTLPTIVFGALSPYLQAKSRVLKRPASGSGDHRLETLPTHRQSDWHAYRIDELGTIYTKTLTTRTHPTVVIVMKAHQNPSNTPSVKDFGNCSELLFFSCRKRSKLGLAYISNEDFQQGNGSNLSLVNTFCCCWNNTFSSAHTKNFLKWGSVRKCETIQLMVSHFQSSFISSLNGSVYQSVLDSGGVWVATQSSVVNVNRQSHSPKAIWLDPQEKLTGE